MLRNGGKFDVRYLENHFYDDYEDEVAYVDLPKQNSILYFDREDIDEVKDEMYYQARAKNFPSLDSFIAPKSIFQMIIAKVHPIKLSGLKLLCNKFGGESAKDPIHYYFVLPEHLYDHYKEQKFVNSEDVIAQKIPAWITNRVLQYALKIKL
jgi:hypothetical protein